MPSRISVMFTASSVAPSVRTTSRSRSWVIGRAGRTPCCSNAIAAASTAPIQMGRYRSPCVSLSSRIGWFPGSSTRTPTTRSSCTVPLPQPQARWGGGGAWGGGGSGEGSRGVVGHVGGVQLRPVNGTPESGAQEFPEARFQQCRVQLRRQGREFPQLLGGPRPGLLRTGPEHRRDELLDQAGLALHAGPVDPQMPRLDAVPGESGGGAGNRQVTGRMATVGIGGEQAELHAVGQLL